MEQWKRTQFSDSFQNVVPPIFWQFRLSVWSIFNTLYFQNPGKRLNEFLRFFFAIWRNLSLLQEAEKNYEKYNRRGIVIYIYKFKRFLKFFIAHFLLDTLNFSKPAFSPNFSVPTHFWQVWTHGFLHCFSHTSFLYDKQIL